MANGHGGARAGAGAKPEGYEHPEARLDFERERADHERVKREQREFKLAQERGEYVRRDHYRQATATGMAMFTQAARAIPDNLERTLALSPEIVEKIATAIDEALAELANTFKSLDTLE